MLLLPERRTVGLNDTVVLTLRVETNGVEMVGFQSDLEYNPVFLQVVDAEGNPASQIDAIRDKLDEVFTNDVMGGTIRYDSVAFQNPNPTEPFDAAKIRFKVIRCVASSDQLPSVAFVGSTGVADRNGDEITGRTVGARIGYV